MGLRPPTKGCYRRSFQLYIQRGTLDLAGFMETMQDGLVITDLQGLHLELTRLWGLFPGSPGYLVQSGQITRPVEQITVAGNCSPC